MASLSSQESIRRPVDYRLWHRRGIAGWWLNLSAPPRPGPQAPIAEAERIRKAEVTSFSILAIFALLVALASNSLANPVTVQAVGAEVIMLVITGILNRTGYTRSAAYVLPGTMMAIIFATLLRGPAGDGAIQLASLTTYDLFVIPIFVVSLIGDRRATWLFAVVAIAFTIGGFLLAPHTSIKVAVGVSFDDIKHAAQSLGDTWGLLNRHVALLFFAALISWLGARSADRAFARADSADRAVAIMEQKAREREEFARAIGDFLQEVGDAFRAQANGQLRLLNSRPRDDPFYTLVLLLNERLTRFEQFRRERAIWEQERVAQAVLNLTIRVKRLRQGEISLQLLDPSSTRTGIGIVDELAWCVYDLLVFATARQPSMLAEKRRTSNVEPFTA